MRGSTHERDAGDAWALAVGYERGAGLRTIMGALVQAKSIAQSIGIAVDPRSLGVEQSTLLCYCTFSRESGRYPYACDSLMVCPGS
jgi:hypothetical protein